MCSAYINLPAPSQQNQGGGNSASELTALLQEILYSWLKPKHKNNPGFGANKINLKLEKNKALAVCKITLCFVMSNYTMRVVFLFIRSLSPTQDCLKSFKLCVLGAYTGLKSELNHILPSLMPVEIPNDTAETGKLLVAFQRSCGDFSPPIFPDWFRKGNGDVWSVPWVFETLVESSGRSCRDCLYHHQWCCSFQEKRSIKEFR